MADFKERIEELCKDYQLSYQQFADKVNAVESEGAKLSKSIVADIVNSNRQPGYKTIIRIARAFNISVDYLLGLTDEKEYDMSLKSTAKVTGLDVDAIKSFTYFKNVFPELGQDLSEIISFLMDECSYSLIDRLARDERRKLEPRENTFTYDLPITEKEIRIELVDEYKTDPETFAIKHKEQISKDYTRYFGVIGSLTDYFVYRKRRLRKNSPFTVKDKNDQAVLHGLDAFDIENMFLLNIMDTIRNSRDFNVWLYHKETKDA